jgi:hypothetical protein
MGLSPSACRLLVKHHACSPLQGPVLALGNPDVFADASDLRAWCLEMGVDPAPVQAEPHSSDYFRRIIPERSGDFVHARTLFSTLGVEGYSDLDLLPIDSAEVVHDLNEPLPTALEGRFGTVLDAGTCEHVFDVRQALTNVARACRVGGQVLHLSPALNYLDHGFYALSPTLFFDFYRANGFEVTGCWVWSVNPHSYFETCPYFSYEYGMDTRPLLEPGRYGYVFFAACKTREVEAFTAPMQGYYSQHLSSPSPFHSADGSAASTSRTSVERALVKPAPALLKRLAGPLRPILFRLVPPYKRLPRI